MKVVWIAQGQGRNAAVERVQRRSQQLSTEEAKRSRF